MATAANYRAEPVKKRERAAGHIHAATPPGQAGPSAAAKIVTGPSQETPSQDSAQTVATPADGLGRVVVHSVVWVAVQKWGTTLCSLVTFIVLSRLLDPSAIGVAALATVFLTIFQTVADQGFSKALVQRAEVDDNDRNSAFRVSMATAIALTAITFALSPFLSSLFNQPQLGSVLCALTPILILGALASVQQATLQRRFMFRSLMIRTLLATFLGAIVGITCAVLGLGVWSIVLQAVVADTTAVIVVWRVSDWRPSLSIRRYKSPELRKTGIHIFAIELIGLANSQADKLIVGAFLGPQDLGLYYIATRIVAMIVDVQTSVVESVSLTTLSRLQHDRTRLRDAFYKLTSLGAASGIALFSIVAVVAPVIIPLLFGPAWVRAVPIMQILCVMGCLNAIIVFDRNALIAVGSAMGALTLTVVQCFVGVAAFGLAVHFGVVSVAVAAVIRQYALWPFRLRTVRNAMGIRLRQYLRNWLGPMASGLLVFGLGFIANQIWPPGQGTLQRVYFLGVASALGLAIYVTSLRLTSRFAFDNLQFALSNLRPKGLIVRSRHHARHSR